MLKENIGRAQRSIGRAQMNIGRAWALPGLYKTTPLPLSDVRVVRREAAVRCARRYHATVSVASTDSVPRWHSQVTAKVTATSRDGQYFRMTMGYDVHLRLRLLSLFIRSKLSIFSAHVSGIAVTGSEQRPAPVPPLLPSHKRRPTVSGDDVVQWRWPTVEAGDHRSRPQQQQPSRGGRWHGQPSRSNT